MSREIAPIVLVLLIVISSAFAGKAEDRAKRREAYLHPMKAAAQRNADAETASKVRLLKSKLAKAEEKIKKLTAELEKAKARIIKLEKVKPAKPVKSVKPLVKPLNLRTPVDYSRELEAASANVKLRHNARIKAADKLLSELRERVGLKAMQLSALGYAGDDVVKPTLELMEKEMNTWLTGLGADNSNQRLTIMLVSKWTANGRAEYFTGQYKKDVEKLIMCGLEALNNKTLAELKIVKEKYGKPKIKNKN